MNSLALVWESMHKYHGDRNRCAKPADGYHTHRKLQQRMGESSSARQNVYIDSLDQLMPREGGMEGGLGREVGEGGSSFHDTNHGRSLQKPMSRILKPAPSIFFVYFKLIK